MSKLNKTRYLVPNIFTSLNFLLGVWAIILATDSVLERGNSLWLAGNFIVYCVLFDKLDGFAARLFKASSEFGAQFDSLADLMAFGLAPSMLMLFAYINLAPEWFQAHKLLVFIGVSMYVLCAAIRLARYNAIDIDGGDGTYFVGMPSTLAGATNALIAILFINYGLFKGSTAIIPIQILIVTAFLMVSPLTIPKLQARKSKLINYFQIFCIVAAYVLGLMMKFPEFLAVLIIIYLTVGGVYSNLVSKDWKKEFTEEG